MGVITFGMNDSERSYRSNIRSGALALLVFFQMALIVAGSRALMVNEHGPNPMSLTLPFEALWRSPFSTACSELLGQLVTYATLSVTLCVWLSCKTRLSTAATVVTLLALASASVEIFESQTTGSIDLTCPILAAVIAAVTARFTQVFLAVRSNLQTAEANSVSHSQSRPAPI
jgi:hypothetical protein